MPGPTMNREDSRIRAARAYDLHLAGRTWQEVADACGFASRGAAQLAVKRHIERNPIDGSPIAQKKSADRLGLVVKMLFAVAADAREAGEPAVAIAAGRAIGETEERRNRLLGLNAPARSEVSVRPDRAFLEAWWSRLKSLPPGAVQRQLPVVDAEVL
jgi:hypothetical protein